MEEGADQRHGDADIYALKDEAAYLQTHDDEKPAIIADPLPDPVVVACSFCKRSTRPLLGGTPMRDPNTLAIIAFAFICHECVARFARQLPRASPEAPPTP